MRHLVASGVMLAILAGSAHAQMGSTPEKDPTKAYFEGKEKEKADAEKAYNEQMKRLKGQNPTDVKRDPWATVRPADTTTKR